MKRVLELLVKIIFVHTGGYFSLGTFRVFVSLHDNS